MEIERGCAEAPIRLSETSYRNMVQFLGDISTYRLPVKTIYSNTSAHDKKISQSLDNALAEIFTLKKRPDAQLHKLGLYSVAIGATNLPPSCRDLVERVFKEGIVHPAQGASFVELASVLGAARTATHTHGEAGLDKTIQEQVENTQKYADWQEGELGLPREPLYLASLMMGAAATLTPLLTYNLKNQANSHIVNSYL